MFEPAPSTSAAAQPHLLVTLVCDLILKLMFELPPMRDHLGELAKNGEAVKQQVEAMFEEVSAKLSPEDTDNLTKYFAVHHAQTQLFTIFRDAVHSVLADGKVDASDAVHFVTLVTRLITLMNESTKSASESVTVSSDGVLLFLYFTTKAILVFALDAAQEQVAVQLLQQAFELVQLSVKPIDIQVNLRRCLCWRC